MVLIRCNQNLTNSQGGKLSIPVDFWRDNNFNSFHTNNTEIYWNLKVLVVLGLDFGVKRQIKSLSE